MPSPVNLTLSGQLVLQDIPPPPPPIQAGIGALHFETDIHGQAKRYLTAADIGIIKRASLNDGGVIKPVSMWKPTTG